MNATATRTNTRCNVYGCAECAAVGTGTDADRGAHRLLTAMTSREYNAYTAQGCSHWSDIAATPKAKSYLRSLLAASTDAVLVQELRAYFNGLRTYGEQIMRAEVSAAIRLLTT